MTNLGDKWSHALRPDSQSFDEVQIKTIPRYKTSGLSGNEWRIHAEVYLLRKGQIVKQRGYGDIESASKFLSWLMVETVENGGGHFDSIADFCDQEGCSESATVFYQKKKEWCGRCGESREITWGKLYRQFCSVHKTRGDCGLDDCDDNYIAIENPKA